MALRIDKPGRREEYVLNADRESSEPTVFELRPLTWEEMAEVNEQVPMTPEQALQVAAIVAPARAEGRELNEDEILRIHEAVPMDVRHLRKVTKQMAVAARYGIARIRNLLDLDGNVIEMGSAEFARQAPAEALREIGARVLEISRHPGDTIKK